MPRPSIVIPALPPRQRAQNAASQLLILLPALELAVVPDASRAPLTSSSHARSSDHPSRPPWSPPVASAIFTLRKQAALVARYLATPSSSLPRSESQVQSNLAFIAAAVTQASPGAAFEAAIRLERSVHLALQALGSEERWSPLPRLPGSLPPRCPFTCGLRSLRMRPYQGTVKCITPSCQDSHGFPHPSAEAYPRSDPHSPGNWIWVLIWRDGTQGIPERSERNGILHQEETKQGEAA